MSSLKVKLGDRWWLTDRQSIEISQTLRFDGQQAQFFGVEPASSQPLCAGDFVGNTDQGGSCNVERISLVPHCNGTHTESAAHLDRSQKQVLECAPQLPLPALLLSLTPVSTQEHGEALPGSATTRDQVICARQLEQALASHEHATRALVIRTLPNQPDKLARNWDGGNGFPYFTADAGNYLRQHGVRHLLLDTPSMDRADDPQLSAHRGFFALDQDAIPRATITEMCFVPDTLEDGYYLLDLQVAPFASDAAPSRPLLTRLICDD